MGKDQSSSAPEASSAAETGGRRELLSLGFGFGMWRVFAAFRTICLYAMLIDRQWSVGNGFPGYHLVQCGTRYGSEYVAGSVFSLEIWARNLPGSWTQVLMSLCSSPFTDC